MRKRKNNVSLVRSENMRAIRSVGNRTTELRLKALLIRSSIRGWRLHPKGALAKPDFYFPKERIAVFVDGCFWHGCPRCGHIPRTNRSYWITKIARNKSRDSANSRALRVRGYRVIRIWECQLREQPNRCIRRILQASNSRRPTLLV
jgi:DNA mismatch endonuclease, patch repair protein